MSRKGSKRLLFPLGTLVALICVGGLSVSWGMTRAYLSVAYVAYEPPTLKAGGPELTLKVNLKPVDWTLAWDVPSDSSAARIRTDGAPPIVTPLPAAGVVADSFWVEATEGVEGNPMWIPLDHLSSNDHVTDVIQAIFSFLDPPGRVVEGFQEPWWLDVNSEGGVANLGILAPPTRAVLVYRAKDVSFGREGLRSSQVLGSVGVIPRTATVPSWYVLRSFGGARVRDDSGLQSGTAAELLWLNRISGLSVPVARSGMFAAFISLPERFDAGLIGFRTANPVESYSIEGFENLEIEMAPEGELLVAGTSGFPVRVGPRISMDDVRDAVITLDTLQGFAVRGVSNSLWLDETLIIPRRWMSVPTGILAVLLTAYLAALGAGVRHLSRVVSSQKGTLEPQ